MAGSTADSAADAGGQRRVGQVMVVLACVLALVVAGAITPSLGSPFESGPSVNASALGGTPIDGGGENASGGGGGAGALGGGGGDSGAFGQQGIGSSSSSRVGGPESLAGFANQSGEVLFAVESARNTYYRVGAYRSFDGYSWSRPSETSAFSGAVPGATPPGESFTARVTLSAPASALPVPWQPQSIDGPSGLAVRETGGIVPRGEFSQNESFTVTAVEPTRDPDVLADSGYRYPASIRDGYLDVDETVSDRVASLAERVTADADDPYAEAIAIEQFLESNKSYSLSATTDPDRPVTEQFLFEMDAGYCQHFASTMAVMLRSQGIPARYVVGYAPGTPVGDDTYAVTGAQAHAWVEVYFADVGWVRFDPTPAADRERADAAVANESTVRDSFRDSELSDDVNASDFEPSDEGDTSGDGGETVEGNESNGGSGDGGGEGDGGGGEESGENDGGDESGDDESDDGDDDGDDSDDDDSGDGDAGDGGGESGADGLQVTLDREPAPGAEVTVTVTRGGEPVLGASVYFEDEYVGRTNYEGKVTGTVPYVRNLTVRVEAPNESTPTYRLAVAGDRIESTGSAGSDRSGGTGQPPALADSRSRPDNESNETVEFAVRSAMAFQFAGEPVPGSTVPLRVSIDGAPVADAAVFLDGERVGRTNRSGWVRVRLPADTGRVSVRASRGEISDETALSLATTVAVSLDRDGRSTGEGVRVVPGESVRVNATFDGEAFANGTVSIDGSQVGTTDATGHATVDVPRDATGTVTVTVTRGVFEGSATAGVVSNATISFEYPPSPGGNVTVVVSAGGESLEDATVSVAGDPAGTTGSDGRATVAVAANATGSLNVSAERGSVAGAVVVDLFEPNLSVTPAYLLALPGVNATVNVTDAGRPVRGMTVHVGASERSAASRAGVTDRRGSVEVGFPFRNAVTVHASAYGATASTRVGWLFGNLLTVVFLLVVAGVVALGAVTRRGRLGEIARRVETVARRVGRAVVRWLFALVSWLDDLVDRLPGLPARLRAFLERLVQAPIRTLRDLGDRFVAWLAALAAGVLAAVHGLFADDEGETGSSSAGSGSAADAGSASSAEPTPNEVVRAAWRALVAIVAPSRLRTRTPGEIARLARERGLPAGAVETITETYREAVYGDREPSSEAVADVEAARETLESDRPWADVEEAPGSEGDDDGPRPATDGGTAASKVTTTGTDQSDGSDRSSGADE